ncbi:sensor histidine kinase [Pararobbsia silviterrae]|uniref:histidine kinase n=1 Tax=Pararobbsia silviterrae TaxID=1792498 RepID=A0A494XG99_9BURK|nr:sensor histidine kinase [Pararobbsia silviterrae]RKP46623.1 histidine kinase [Pararobbsia silviterrae]
MRLFTKGLLLIAIPSVFEIGLLGLVYATHLDTEVAGTWAAHSKRVIGQTNDVLEPMLVQSIRVRSAALANDPAAIDDTALWTELDRRVDRLTDLVADNPPQVARAAQIRNTIQQYREWSSHARELIETGQREALIAHLSEPQGSALVDTFRRELNAFKAEELRLDAARTEAVHEARERQRGLLIGAVFGSIAVASVAMYLFIRGFRGRLLALGENARRLADNTPLPPALAGDDEVAQLDGILHTTSRRLAAADRARNAVKRDLEHRAAQLALANEHLRLQTADNEMFIYSVSHDLRSPLVNLQGFSRELAHTCKDLRDALREFDLPEHEWQRFAQLLDEEIAESLHYLQTAVMRSADIIDALLTLSRAGRAEYRPERVDLNVLVQRIAARYQAKLEALDARLVVHPLPAVEADPDAIEQVFSGLVDHAIESLDPGRAARIEIGAREFEDHRERAGQHPLQPFATLYVADNGRGIAASQLSKVFAAFYRPQGGGGVALALVRRIVERHGGRLWVESVEQSGSTFYMTLPIGGVLPAMPPAAAESAA